MASAAGGSIALVLRTEGYFGGVGTSQPRTTEDIHRFRRFLSPIARPCIVTSTKSAQSADSVVAVSIGSEGGNSAVPRYRVPEGLLPKSECATAGRRARCPRARPCLPAVALEDAGQMAAHGEDDDRQPKEPRFQPYETFRTTTAIEPTMGKERRAVLPSGSAGGAVCGGYSVT